MFTNVTNVRTTVLKQSFKSRAMNKPNHISETMRIFSHLILNENDLSLLLRNRKWLVEQGLCCLAHCAVYVLRGGSFSQKIETANPKCVILLCGISCELAGCVHRPIVDSESTRYSAEAKPNLSQLYLSRLSLAKPAKLNFFKTRLRRKKDSGSWH